jgi:predicted transposase YbfD/YdcC
MNNTILPFDLTMPQEPILIDVDAFYQAFWNLTDQRSRRGVRYPLALMLTIAVLAKLAGQDEIEGIAHWASLRAKDLAALFRRQRLTMPHVVTWHRVLASAVNPEEITRVTAEVLASASAEVPERGSILLTFDGKTLRGTIPTGSTRGVHLLAAFRPDVGVVLVQMAVDQKENEIVVAPQILRQLDLTGMVVTGDAMHTQRNLSIQIVEQGGDYLWTVKDNQPTLHTDVEMLFDPALVAAAGGESEMDFRRAKTIEKSHGRLDERTITVSSLLQETSDWPYLHQAFCVEHVSINQQTGKETRDVRYGITSQPPEVAGPEKLLAQVRGEWSIETGVHGRRDVTLKEDEAHLCQGQAAHVMATLNNTIIGIVLKHGYDNLAQARRVLDHAIGEWIHNLCRSW